MARTLREILAAKLKGEERTVGERLNEDLAQEALTHPDPAVKRAVRQELFRREESEGERGEPGVCRDCALRAQMPELDNSPESISQTHQALVECDYFAAAPEHAAASEPLALARIESRAVDGTVRLRMAKIEAQERAESDGVLAVVEDAIECELEDVEPPRSKACTKGSPELNESIDKALGGTETRP